MNQGQLAELFVTSTQNIGQLIKTILDEKELRENSVVKNFFTTAANGKNYEGGSQIRFWNSTLIWEDEEADILKSALIQKRNRNMKEW